MHKYVFIMVFIFCSDLKAQNRTVLDSITFYGWFREHASVYDGNVQLQDNSPRIGIKIMRKLPTRWYAKAQLEYGIHIVQGVSFNNDANTAQELIADPFVNSAPFTPRLATVELGNDKWGSISIGKQWGAYYDIAFYTDRFNLFGGSANGVYSGGTDGGWSGTGRADKAIVYRNTFKNLDLSVQTQLNGKTTNLGLAAQYHFSKNWVIGTGYNTANISTTAQFLINDIGKNVNNFITGIKYNKGKYYVGFTASQSSGDIIVLNNSTILALPMNGTECSFSYFPSKTWSFDTGINYAISQKYSTTLGGNYRLLHIIAAANYYLTPKTRIYATIRVSNSQLVNYLDSVNVYALGLRYEFSFDKGIISIN